MKSKLILPIIIIELGFFLIGLSVSNIGIVLWFNGIGLATAGMWMLIGRIIG